jgi:hypothetical protein
MLILEKLLGESPDKNTFWRTRMPVHLKFESQQEEIAFYQEAMAKLGKDLTTQISSPEFIRDFLAWKKSQ